MQGIGKLGACLAIVSMAFAPALGDDVDQAIYGGPSDQLAAAARLREMGPPGLARLMDRVKNVEQQLAVTPNDAQLKDTLAALDRALEQVGGAKYCRQSGLYWYTDLERAKAAARAEGKPILALRMLGNLTDEFSCANSRFFRATLYANAEISRYLRQNFVLTWKSVRPVPKVTIDFGDGRKLERTLTGNSIHYILTPEGQVVDALPGLVGPATFLAKVQQAGDLSRSLASLPPAQQSAALLRFHHRALNDIAVRWQADLESAQMAPPIPAQPASQDAPMPTAKAAVVIARTKADIELPLLVALQPQFTDLEQRTTDKLWERIAELHATEATLDASSRKLVGAHRPNAAQAGRLAMTKRVVEDPLLRLVENLQRSISLDTVKNEYTLHRTLHAWLAESPGLSRDVDTLNEQVYAKLFLTPSADPWLGLAPPDVYAALPNNGIVTPLAR